ncbi:MAG: ABC transporter ATP-binding protein/permease [Oscillospiraceae bacterium]|nr:ABC transporter ATP-binding protein/permease [Oscillospiraceae bacterium]
MNYLGKYWRKHRTLFLIGVSCVLMEATCDLFQPRIMSLLVDNGAMRGSLSDVRKYGLIMLGIAMLGLCFALTRNYIAARVSQRFAAELRLELFEKIHSLSAYGIDSFEGGSLITRETNDVTQMQNFVNGLMRVVVKSPFVCIGAIIMAASLSLRTMPIIIPIVAVVIIVISICMKLAYPRFGRMQDSLDRVNTAVREYLAGIRLVKAFRRFRDEEARFDRSNNELADAAVDANRVLVIFSPFMALFVNFGVAAILWFGSRWVDFGDMQVGQIIAFVSYMANILTSLNMISNTLNMFVRVRASHRRIAEVFSTEPGSGAGTGEIAAQPVVGAATAANVADTAAGTTTATGETTAAGAGAETGTTGAAGAGAVSHAKAAEAAQHIEFRGVGFQYRGSTGQPALDGISFSLKKGETLGIIGPTGSGKSTLAALLLRFYDPTEGEILADDEPLSAMSQAEWRSRVAIVPQAPALFSGTIKENIAWGKPSATEQEVERATRDAQAYGFITSMQEGFAREIGQAGTGLSGGQKQRVSIARALVRCPELLVLDDCTSALDVMTEAAVKDALAQYTMTTVFITQRVATARGCDKILVLENGLMAGFGSHEDLMSSCPVYRDIFRSQIGGDGDG